MRRLEGLQLSTPVHKVKEEADDVLSSHSTEAGACVLGFELDDCADELHVNHGHRSTDDDDFAFAAVPATAAPSRA